MLRLITLGRLTLVGDDGPITGSAVQPRRLAVFALLARAGNRGITRDKLLGLLWPDLDDERGRRALAQALYAMRRELGTEEAFVGTKDLRLNADVVSSDVSEFEQAIATGQLERAVELYGGAFADGFRLAGSPEFERWLEGERQSLAHDYALAVEKLAASSAARGDRATTVDLWRKLAAIDPLNARVAINLMEALVAAGDVNGALQHARVYEALIDQELDLPPDRQVADYAERLRRGEGVVAAPPPAEPPPLGVMAPERAANDVRHSTLDSGAHSATTPAASAEVTAAARPGAATAGLSDTAGSPRRRWYVVAAVAAVAAIATVAVLLRRDPPQPPSASAARVIAVGKVADYRAVSGDELGRPLADMLATNLARIEGARVISSVRMYELLARGSNASDTAGSAVMAAARRAGATHLVDGALYAVGPDRYRFDIRVVDVGSGNVVAAYTVNGSDPFTLADSGTARLTATVGGDAPRSSVVEVTTRSLTAYRLYEAGLRLYAESQYDKAKQLFESALAEDSSFAMAAFYAVRSTSSLANAGMWERARRLARQAGERERLLIEAWYASTVGSARQSAVADTLAERFPDEVDGHILSGMGALARGETALGLRRLTRVIAMDSLDAPSDNCRACQVLPALIVAYEYADSAQAAERTARLWTRLQPRSAPAWRKLALLLMRRSRPEEARRAAEKYAEVRGVPGGGPDFTATMFMAEGKYDQAEKILRTTAGTGSFILRASAAGDIVTALAEQGRMEEALVAAIAYRKMFSADVPPSAIALGRRVPEATVRLYLGQGRAAAAMFDSIGGLRGRGDFEAMSPTLNSVWLTLAGEARAVAGDTSALEWLADTIQARSATIASRNVQILHYHVRGLLSESRGRTEEAIAAYRNSIDSPTMGLTRTNYHLARLLMDARRPAEAVATLQSALMATMVLFNGYITRTELRERLAQAWEAAGRPDSARVHYRYVADAWKTGDPAYRVRARAAAERVTALGR